MAQSTAFEFAASVKDKLTSEFPDLYVEIDPMGPTLRFFGAEDFVKPAMLKAAHLVEISAHDILIDAPVDLLLCNKSETPLPPKLVEWDDRRIGLVCNSAVSHQHRWPYPALKPRALGM
ncbi:MAG: hypothetical protein IIC91_08605 [Chloroflexi bacterium]|nr:hypothetical protein [Chloroflexota bacterium]